MGGEILLEGLDERGRRDWQLETLSTSSGVYIALNGEGLSGSALQV
jgi:hypothetical protein